MSSLNRWSSRIAFVLAFVGCARGDDVDRPEDGAESGFRELRSSQPHDPAPPVTPDDYAKVIAGTTDFGLALFRKAAPADDNFFYSPASTALALGMIYAGARGNTAAEMATVLGSTVPQDVFASSMNRLMLDLAARNIAPHGPPQSSKNLTLLPANAVWMQEALEIGPDFLDTMSTRYDAGIKVLDFAKDPDFATDVINRWVAARTRDKILDLIPKGAIGRDTPLVLTNALYFYGSWEQPFIPASTVDQTFHAVPEGDVTVPTMRDGRFVPYAEGDGYQMIDLAYDGRQLAMTLVLPAEGRFAEVREKLSPAWLDSARATINGTNVRLAVPKFRFTWGTESLRDELQALGMIDAFVEGTADFSGIVPKLVISDVLHKAFVGVDEFGTEAAAATAIVTRIVSAPTYTRDFIVDRPFFVFIRDATGALLFTGQVTNPAR
jgi:serpin B